MAIRILVFMILFGTTSYCSSQSKEYFHFARKADSLYRAQDYKLAAICYTDAFKVNGWNGNTVDKYNAACSRALSDYADSAFFYLEGLARNEKFSNYDHILNDSDLIGLHSDNRWISLIELVKQNKEKKEANLNKPLASKLDSIYTEDQKYRQMIDDIGKKHGYESIEMKTFWGKIKQKDSINLIKVKAILDEYGWLGTEEVGSQGNITLFLVIQHSDQKTQEQYLPMMRKAVQLGKAQASNLALLEDRVALGQGKKQIYGSQIHRDGKSGRYFVAPIEDEPNVNERRAAVGLDPLEVYAKQWGIDYKAPKK